MNHDFKKDILIIAVGLALCLALLGSWKLLMNAAVSSDRNAAGGSAIVIEQRPEATVPASTAVEETLPEETVMQTTVPEETQPPKVTIDTVPLYYQTDYPDDRYGTGTIASSGSNMTALAMVASFMTDHAYYPDEIADYMAHFLCNNYERLEKGSDLLQLPWKRAVNVRETIQAVRDGKVAIVLLGEGSVFTNSQHFIVLTGVNEEGKLLVNDPNEKHYSVASLADSFENGFTDGNIVAGYQGGWIYDKSAMPEEPFIYEPEPPAEEPRYGDLELTDADKDLIAKLICAEGASEPFEGQQAIAEVILNRLASGKFQSSVYNIIYAADQFASVNQLYKAEPTYSQYKAIEQALYGPYVLPMDVYFFAKGALNDNVWGKIGAHTFCYSY